MTTPSAKKLRDDLRKVVSPATKEMLDALLLLGFTAETYPVLPLVPLIAVGWADGKVTKKERAAILAVAADDKLGPAAMEMLNRLLSLQFDPAFLRRSLRLLVKVFGSMHLQEGTRAKRKLLEQAAVVANASGGWLGFFGDKISGEEQEMLDQITAGLRISGVEREAALVEKLISRNLNDLGWDPEVT